MSIADYEARRQGGVLFCTAEQFGRIIDGWIGMGSPS